MSCIIENSRLEDVKKMKNVIDRLFTVRGVMNKKRTITKIFHGLQRKKTKLTRGMLSKWTHNLHHDLYRICRSMGQ